MHKTGLTRRGFIGRGVAGIGAAALPFGLAGRAFAQDGLTIGVVYVGPKDDFGWNQAHAVAMDILKGVPGVTVDQVVIGTASVEYDPTATTPADLTKVVEEEGYHVVSAA